MISEFMRIPIAGEDSACSALHLLGSRASLAPVHDSDDNCKTLVIGGIQRSETNPTRNTMLSSPTPRTTPNRVKGYAFTYFFIILSNPTVIPTSAT